MAQLSTDIIDWALDANGDIAVGQDVSWTSNLAAVVQSCQIAISMVRGEWFLNNNGVPLWERPGVPAADALLGQPFNSLKVIAAYRAELLRVPHVITILSLAVTPPDKVTRKIRLTWSVRTTYGDTPAQAALVGGI